MAKNIITITKKMMIELCGLLKDALRTSVL